MKLINTREFVEAFTFRNVVFESYAGFDKAGKLVLRTIMEFGEHGRIKRTRTIDCSGKSIHNIHTEMGEYQMDVMEIINVLEDYVSWVKSGNTEVFSEFIGSDELPLYFHGHRAKSYPSLCIFGQDLKNLELQGKSDPSKPDGVVPYVERINALADCYRKHLKELDSIPANVFQGSYVTRHTGLGLGVVNHAVIAAAAPQLPLN